MKSSFIPLAQLFSVTKTIEGRKKCQKIVHILQSCGVDFGCHFKFALYGAYSSSLSLQLEDLVTYHYLSETPKPIGNYTVGCFEADEKVSKALESLEEDESPSWADLALKLNAKPTRELEGTSTVIFLRASGFAADHLRTKFETVKPHLKDDFDKCVAFADEILNVPKSA